MAGGYLAAESVEHQAGHRRGIHAATERIDEWRQNLLAVPNGHGVDRRVGEPLGLARRVVTAQHHERTRQLLADSLRQPDRAEALSREVALQTDHVGVEGAN